MVNFSEEWDKLKPDRLVVGAKLTTFRGYTPQKETYYLGKLNKGDNILLKKKIIAFCRLIHVQVERSHNLDLEFWKSDTYQHYTMTDIDKLMYKFYKNKNPIGLVLTYEITGLNEVE